MRRSPTQRTSRETLSTGLSKLSDTTPSIRPRQRPFHCPSPSPIQPFALLLRPLRRELTIERPVAPDILQPVPVPDRESSQIRGTKRGRLTHDGKPHGHT